MKWTIEELLAEIQKTYTNKVCLDLFADAQNCDTIQEAATWLIFDSMYWNGEALVA